MGQMVTFTRPDGSAASGYLALPPDERPDAPGVVVIEEWWGVTDQIKKTADDFAARGYRALVPDLFGGKTAVVADEAHHLMEGLDFATAATQEVAGAVTYLKASGAKCATVGFCMGGAVGFINAMHAGGSDALVAFYGFPPPQAGDPGALKIWVQAHAALRDEFFKPEDVRVLEQKMQDGGVNFELYWYDAAHGFSNPNPPGEAGLGHYDDIAAKAAFARTYEFLERVL